MSFLGLKKKIPGDSLWFDDVRNTVNQILLGKLSNVHTCTLSMNTGSASTVVVLSHGELGPNTHVALEPTNLGGAQAIASGTMYVSNRDTVNNTITITHSVDTSITRSFRFTLTG